LPTAIPEEPVVAGVVGVFMKLDLFVDSGLRRRVYWQRALQAVERSLRKRPQGTFT
jgi:hypothetical protein